MVKDVIVEEILILWPDFADLGRSSGPSHVLMVDEASEEKVDEEIYHCYGITTNYMETLIAMGSPRCNGYISSIEARNIRIDSGTELNVMSYKF